MTDRLGYDAVIVEDGTEVRFVRGADEVHHATCPCPVCVAKAAEAKIRAIARTRRPTEAESAEATAAYARAAAYVATLACTCVDGGRPYGPDPHCPRCGDCECHGAK
jgi:hypothetical protein